jgi:4-aminobutyrate aminotransferase-like enzyme
MGETRQADEVNARIRATEGAGLRTFRAAEPRVWDRAEGAFMWDVDGNRFVDLDSASGVQNIGHCHPAVTAAIRDQAGRLTHAPSGSPTVARADFYERLLRIAPSSLTKVLPAVNGALANETAVQLARAKTGRHTVLTFAGTYLGRSLGSVARAGKSAYREQLGVRSDAHFFPYPDEYRTPWSSKGEVHRAVLGLIEQSLFDPASGIDAPAAIVLEPVQCNGGVVIPPDGFLRGLRTLADASGAVLIFDEIQSGFGRTGRMWACQHEDVEPDLMTVGKGIGGGLGTAAVLGGDDIMSTWEPDAVTSTFLVNALNCVAASAAIDVMVDEGLVERSCSLGADLLQRLRAELDGCPTVGDVRGRGLLCGLDIVQPGGSMPDADRAARLAGRMGELGVLVGRSGRFGNVLKLCPPLIISADDLKEAIDVVVSTIHDDHS